MVTKAKSSTDKAARKPYVSPRVVALDEKLPVPSTIEIPSGFSYELLPLCGGKWDFIQMSSAQIQVLK